MTDRFNLYIDQGTNYQVPLHFFDEDGPIDVTLYTFVAQIRKLYSTKKIADFTFIPVDLEAGFVEMVMSKETTASLNEGKYQYDILAIHENGIDTVKVLEGLVYIISTISKIVVDEIEE